MNDFINRFKDQVRSNFDASRQEYLFLELKHDFYGKLTDKLVNFIGETGVVPPGWDRQGMKILDVGCGIGNSTKRLSERFAGAGLSGIDLSPKMLEAATEQLPGINFVCGDGENLSDYFPQDSFDLVVYSASLFILPQQEQSLQQARGLLKEGGVVAASVLRGMRERSGAQINSLSDMPGIVKNERLLPCLQEMFSKVYSSPLLIPIHREVLKDIYSIPALLAGLFPKLPPQQRLIKVNELINEVSERNLELLQDWVLIAARK